MKDDIKEMVILETSSISKSAIKAIDVGYVDECK